MIVHGKKEKLMMIYKVKKKKEFICLASRVKILQNGLSVRC